MRWVLPVENRSQAELIARELSLHPVCAGVLVARGYETAEAASRLFQVSLADLPDPRKLPGMDAAVERLCRALAGGEKITCYGDYDVDGVTATAQLYTFLKALGAKVASYLPHRLEEGYGLNREAVEKLAADGTRILVSLDCGVTAVEEVKRARELGMEVIVIDHHQPGPSVPEALAVLDPHLPGNDFPAKEACAAGLTFLVMMALRRRLRETGFFAGRSEPNLKEFLDLAALGTIADVVPLTGLNRVLVKHGLAEIAAGKRLGVRALKETSGFAATAPLSAGQVAFRLAPRINAAGRLAAAQAGLELLTTSDPGRAALLARQLDESNTERQQLEKRILGEALEQAEQLGGQQARGLVLASAGWHPGVIGIVAARVVERFHRPTFVVALEGGKGKGSGRSIEGFHLHEALQHCAQHLTRFGGHRHAAGLSIEEEAVPSFRAAFDALARERLAPEFLEPRCRIDALVDPSQLDQLLAASLERLAPFGAGNPEPVLAALGLSGNARVLTSKTGGAGHLKLSLDGARSLDVIGFGLAEQAELARDSFDAAFHLGVDEWNGKQRLSLKLKTLRAAQ